MARGDGLHVKHSQMYNSYRSLNNRCKYPTNNMYKHYGGRGIRNHWGSFEAFLEDMGDTHFSGATIDRIDTDGDYCKDNCRWLTRTEQNQNKRNNRLSTDSAAAIRALLDEGILTQQTIADRYNIDQPTISNIKSNKYWRV